MELKNKVCTLEQAKKLNDHGFKTKTEKYWYEPEKELYTIPELEEDWVNWRIISGLYSAPDVAELMEMLHPGYRLIRENANAWILQRKDEYCNFGMPATSWHNMPSPVFGIYVDDGVKNAPQAYTAALIWLIENKHFKPEDIK